MRRLLRTTQQQRRKRIKMVKVKEDLTGRVFGRLTVIKQVDDYVEYFGDRRYGANN